MIKQLYSYSAHFSNRKKGMFPLPKIYKYQFFHVKIGKQDDIQKAEETPIFTDASELSHEPQKPLHQNPEQHPPGGGAPTAWHLPQWRSAL